jgi:hypothetical protein
MELQNSLTRLLPNVGFISGTITTPNPVTATPTLTNLSGTVDFDQTAVSVVRNSAGNYTLSVSNFNPLAGSGVAIGFATCSTTGTAGRSQVTVQPGTYSGDTASWVISAVAGSTGLEIDSQVNFLVMAY